MSDPAKQRPAKEQPAKQRPGERRGNDAQDSSLPATSYAVRITLAGRVRGVGLRPFVNRLAREHDITGHVGYRDNKIDIVACGRPAAVRQFRQDLIRRAPPLSKPQIVRLDPIDTVPFDRFEIVDSTSTGEAIDQAIDHVSADYTMCEDCRGEFRDETNRRYGYPFISCSQCGPRYTLTVTPTGERRDTSMSGFDMCADCSREYHDPCNRRFQWAAIGCPVCGPTLAHVTAAGGEALTGSRAMAAAAVCIDKGGIVAVKCIGGYRLMCDAADADAVGRLRRGKGRPEKPLPVAFPYTGKDGLEMLRRMTLLHQFEAEALKSPARPVVLVRKRSNSDLADNIAPGLREVGVMLPVSPILEALLEAVGRPLIATSANEPGEPVVIENDRAVEALSDIADAFLHHDRQIVRPVEDAVFRRIAGKIRPLRPGRGFVPLELDLPWRQEAPLLAVGGDEIGTIALSWDRRAVVTPYLGDMRRAASIDALAEAAADLQTMYGVSARRIVCDANADYQTHRWAMSQSRLPVDTVWHHHAHASALTAEMALPGLWLVFVWDGNGLGEDGTMWGAEAMLGRTGSWRRMASLRPFRVPGGAHPEPWRSAAALKWECNDDWADSPDEDGRERRAWEEGIDCVETSAAGRVFDAASALICGRTETSFPAQAPLLLEALCRQRKQPVYLSLARDAQGVLRSDWRPMLTMLADESRPLAERAERFHASLALSVLQQARRIADEYPIDYVGLCGGVFHNRMLTEQTVELLGRNNFSVHLPRQLPSSDAALSFGQAAEIAARGKFD